MWNKITKIHKQGITIKTIFYFLKSGNEKQQKKFTIYC